MHTSDFGLVAASLSCCKQRRFILHKTVQFGDSIAQMFCHAIGVVTRGSFMKISRWLFSLVLLGLSSSLAMADSVDPVAKLGGGNLSIVLTSLNDPLFTGSFTQQGGQTIVSFDFINNTTFTIGQVNLDVTDNTPLTFSIDNTGDPYFTSFSPTSPTLLSPGDHLTLSWFGLDGTHLGIPPATSVSCIDGCFSSPPLSDFLFTFTVGDVPTGGSFAFTGTLFAVPEPPALLLVLTGGVLLLFLKRS